MSSNSNSFAEDDSLTDGVMLFIDVDLDVLLFEVLVEFFEFTSFGGWKKLEMVNWSAFVFCLPFVGCDSFVFLLEDALGLPGINLRLPTVVSPEAVIKGGEEGGELSKG